MTRDAEEPIAAFREKLRRQDVRLRELEKSQGRLRAFLESASQGVAAIGRGGARSCS